MDYSKTEQLIRDLTKPIFVYRMGTGLQNDPFPDRRKGAIKRKEAALEEIDSLVKRYAEDAS